MYGIAVSDGFTVRPGCDGMVMAISNNGRHKFVVIVPPPNREIGEQLTRLDKSGRWNNCLSNDEIIDDIAEILNGDVELR